MTKNFENANNATDDLKTTKYTDERTLTIEETLRKPESRFNDLRKMETIQDKGDQGSNQSFRHYENYQKIGTAPSEYLQIPSKSNESFFLITYFVAFLSDDPQQTTQNPTQNQVKVKKLLCKFYI